MINDLQPDLARSASNHSIKSQASSTGSIPAPSNAALPKTTALPTKQTGLRAPTPTSTTKPPGMKKKIVFSCENTNEKKIHYFIIN